MVLNILNFVCTCVMRVCMCVFMYVLKPYNLEEFQRPTFMVYIHCLGDWVWKHFQVCL